jgi:hypothetical protein
MPRPRRLLAALVVAAAALVVPLSAAAAPASTTFAIRGVEYGLTPTLGLFAGSATGNAGDRAAWNAAVEHEQLGSLPPVYITGGSVWMGSRSPAGSFDFATANFVDQGGTIETLDPGAGCTNQRYLVSGALENVTTSTSSGGTGSFSVTLTHYRVSIFGRCIAYSASVVGNVSFSY